MNEVLIEFSKKKLMNLSLPSQFVSRLDAWLHALRGETCQCYHCGETMRVKNALHIDVLGQAQPMCCHGCYAVVQTIVRDGLLDQYLAAKNSAAQA